MTGPLKKWQNEILCATKTERWWTVLENTKIKNNLISKQLLISAEQKESVTLPRKGQRGRQGLTGSHLGLSRKVSKRSRPLTGKSGAPYRPSILDQFSNQHLFIRRADVWRALEAFDVRAFFIFFGPTTSFCHKPNKIFHWIDHEGVLPGSKHKCYLAQFFKLP